MIKIEIISAKNLDLMGPRTFYTNSITLGNRLCDIFIEEQPTYYLEVVQNELRFNNQKVRYKLNGKLATVEKTLKTDDLIQLENVEIKILHFSLTKYQSKREFLNLAVDHILNHDDEASKILKELQKNLS